MTMFFKIEVIVFLFSVLQLLEALKGYETDKFFYESKYSDATEPLISTFNNSYTTKYETASTTYSEVELNSTDSRVDSSKEVTSSGIVQVVSSIASTEVIYNDTSSDNQIGNKSTQGQGFLSDIYRRSNPATSTYNETLEGFLNSDSVSDLKRGEKEHSKRENYFPSVEELDKIKIRNLERIQLDLPQQVLKSKKLKIHNGVKPVICRATPDGGTVEIILLNTLSQYKTYSVSGNEPCNILSNGKDVILTHFSHEENPFLIVSKLYGEGLVELQRIGVPGKQLIDISSWQQYGRSFILLKTHLINLTGSIPGVRFILYRQNDNNFEYIQEFDGSTIRMPHHFQVDFDDFLAVPNFITGETEILKYSFIQTKYVVIQKLKTTKATSVSTIEMENSFYLLVTKYCEEKAGICDQNTNSIVFKYNGKEFEPNGYFSTNNAITSLAIEHKKKVWLAVLSSLKGISFYNIHNSKIEEIFPEISYELQSRGLFDLVQFNLGFESYIGVRSILGTDSSWMFFRINFDENDKKLESDAVKNWCYKSLKILNEKFELVENKINRLSSEKSNTENTYEKYLDKAIDDKTFSTFRERVMEVETDLSVLESRVRTIEDRVSDGINIRTTTEWPDGLNFSSISILAVKVEDFFVKYIDNQKVPLIHELIPLNNEYGINLHAKTISNIDFLQPPSIEILNGQPLSSYVTLDGNHTIKSTVIFGQIDTPKLKVGGFIDGVKIDRDSILLNYGNSYFNGTLTCRSISTTSIETDYVNGVNMRNLLSNAFVENSSVIIRGNLEIRGDLIYPGDLSVGSILGKSTKFFTDNILLQNSEYPQIITGFYRIQTMNAKVLQIKSTLNDLPFPESVYINLPERAYHIPKARFESISAKKVLVNKNLNGIKVLDGELDVIPLNGDQIVTGWKSFEGMHLKNYIVIKNQTTSEPEKFQEARNASLKEPELSDSLNKELQFYKTSVKTKDNLKIENTLLNNLYTARTNLMKLIYLEPLNMKESIMTETKYPFISKVLSSLNEDVLKLLSQLETKNFTGIEDVLRFSQKEIIQLGRLSTFKTLPKYLISTITKFYDDLRKAYQLIQVLITQKKKIISILEDNINTFEKRIRKEGERYIGRIDYKGSFVNGLVNGYDLRKILERKRKNLHINENEIIDKVGRADLVIFNKGLITPNINKINLAKLLEEAVPLSSNNISLNLLFQDTVVVQKNVETPLINSRVVSKFGKTNEINLFEKEVEFEDVRFFTDVEVKGSVNNFKIEETAERIARADKPQKFTVPISFNSVEADRINASTIYLNNIPLDEYAFKNENLIITGKKKFANISALNSLVRIENLHTEELDKINLRRRMENRRKVEKDLIIDDISVDKLSIKGNVYIQRYIKDFNQGSLNISSLFEEAVLNNQSETINGSLILQGNVIVKNLDFKTLFDGISSETLDNFVLQKEEQYLHETNVFKTLKVKNLIIKDNKLQGLSLQKLFNDSVKLDENQAFSERVYFGNITSRSAEVSGLVQGVNLTKDAVLYTKPSIITGKKFFVNLVTTNSEITVDGLVNNMNFGEVCKDIAGQVVINGPVYFEKDLTIDSLQVEKHLIPNNYTFYWTKDSNEKIGSHIVFNEVESKGVFITEKLNNEPILNLIDGPIPSNCKENLRFSNLTVQTLATNYAKVKNIQTQNLVDEDSKILDKIILDTFDQTFENLEVGNLSVTGKILVNNYLNEFKLSDFCVRGPACEIRATKRFYNDVNLLKNWDIEDDSRINKIKIKDMKTSDLFNTETVVVKGSLIVPDLTVEGLVQGIKFDQDTVMTLSTPQTMTGLLSISNKNNVAFEANDVTVLMKSFNGIDIDVLGLQPETKEEYNNEVIGGLKNMAEKYQVLKEHTIRLNSVLKNQPIRFDGWELTAKFESAEKIIPIEQEKKSKIFLLALSSPRGIYLKNYIPHLKKTKDYVYIKINCTEDVKGFYIENDLYICASVSCPNPNTNLSSSLQISPDNVPATEKIKSYLWKITPTIPKLYASITTSQVDQILSFKITNRNCMLFLSSYQDEQNIMCEDKWSIILQQTLIIKGVIKALHLTYTTSDYKQIPLLIIGSEEASNELTVIRVMQLDHKNRHYETIQEIQADRLVWITSSEINGIQFLASVHKPFIGSVEGHINIYRLHETFVSGDNRTDVGSDWRFHLQESIYLDDPLQATFLDSLSNEIFLLVLNKNEFIMRYVKRGYGKFEFGGSLHIPGAKSISSWVWKRINSYNLAVSVRETCSNGRLNDSVVYIFNPVYSGRENIVSSLH